MYKTAPLIHIFKQSKHFFIEDILFSNAFDMENEVSGLGDM